MSDRPIIMSGESVRAILAGSKTQSRRVARFVPLSGEEATALTFSGVSVGEYCTDVPSSGRVLYVRRGGGAWHQITEPLHCPYGAPGDRLWVREAHALIQEHADVRHSDRFIEVPVYREGYDGAHGTFAGWRSPIHMPRWASRLTLEVVSVRVERVQAISEDDAREEGLLPAYGGPLGTAVVSDARDAYRTAWDALNGKRPGCSWAANPWVWVLTFRRVEVPGG